MTSIEADRQLPEIARGRTRGTSRRAPAGPGFPVSVASFIGRERQLEEIGQLLAGERLVTLSGPGGVGKTRLALEVGRRMQQRFADGARFVSLASLSDPSLVETAVLHAIGLREHAGSPIQQSLALALRDRALLLVLDNLEHLLDATPRILGWLEACPKLTVLITSRASLGLPGEQVYPVPPLTLPLSLASAEAAEAIRLFVDRARAVRPDFRLTDANAPAVIEICRRLDGLPLAIELAAARARLLTPAQIAARLDDRFRLLVNGSLAVPPRQRTLRDAIAWSYDLLSEPERRLFRRLGVFAGSCTLEAAEAVCDGGARDDPESSPLTPYPSPLDLVGSLVEKSLVVPAETPAGEMRYQMLETVREYALESLAATGEAPALRRWHRDWFLELAEQAAPALFGPEQTGWLDRLEADYDNLRAALRWCLHQPDPESGLRLGAALWRFWEGRNHLTEGRGWLDQLLSLDGASVEPILLGRAQLAAGRMAFLQGDFEAAVAFLEPCLARGRELGDPDLVAYALTYFGHIARDGGDLAGARACYDEALVLWRELDDSRGIAIGLFAFGRLALIEADLDRGWVLLEQSLRGYRAAGDLTDLARVLLALGSTACDLGRLDQARAHFVEGLRIAVGLRDRGRVAANLQGCAVLAAAQSQSERAVLLTTIASTITETTGTLLGFDEQRRLDARIEPVRRALGAARCAALAVRARAMSIDQAVAYALECDRDSSGEHADTADGVVKPAVLTSREQQVMALIGRGYSNRQIADELVLSKRTVEWHVGNLLSKLGVRTRPELVAWASRHEPPRLGAGRA